MGSNARKNQDSTFKSRVALEAFKGEKTMAQLSSKYWVHPNEIRQWRQNLLMNFLVYLPIPGKKR